MTRPAKVTPLEAATAAHLRAAPLTYQQVGASAAGPVEGYRWFSKTAVLSRRDFEGAARDLLTWQVQVRAGLEVAASESPLVDGTVVEMFLGVRPLGMTIPCRVVEVIDEPTRRGFAYGTLPGHPEQGEERFVLNMLPDASLTLTISAFSTPATWLTRLGGPVASMFQDVMTDRYLRSLDKC